MSKQIVSSKTILTNAAIALVGLGIENIDMLRGSMPDNVFFWLLMFSNAAGVALRFVTNTAIEVPDVMKLGREK